MIIDIKNINKKYSIIYTDPPWAQKKGGLRKARPNQGKELDYSTMPMSEIEELHRIIFNRNTTEKHNIFIWAIDKFLPETEQMMVKLGYKLHARMVWDKQNGIAPAFTVRFSHEYLLWFYKEGAMLPVAENMRGKYCTCFSEPATKHSKKPEIAYTMLEHMFPQTEKLELFARLPRRGWDCWGNEIGGGINEILVS